MIQHFAPHRTVAPRLLQGNCIFQGVLRFPGFSAKFFWKLFIGHVENKRHSTRARIGTASLPVVASSRKIGVCRATGSFSSENNRCTIELVHLLSMPKMCYERNLSLNCFLAASPRNKYIVLPPFLARLRSKSPIIERTLSDFSGHLSCGNRIPRHNGNLEQVKPLLPFH